MKQMSLIEMDGFLKGKCIPSDLKVNETNAEYLVRKFAEAQAKCAALAAENAGLKSGAMDEIKVINRGGQAYCVKDGVQVNHMYARGWNDYRAKSLQSDTPPPMLFWLKYGRRAWRCWQKIIRVSSMHLREILYFLMVNTDMQLLFPQLYISLQSFAKEATSERKKND